MSNSNDGYIKVEDTLPGQHQSKEIDNIDLSTKIEHKEPRTLGSFGVHQLKEINDISEVTTTESKEISDIAISSISHNKKTESSIENISVDQSKEEAEIEVVSDSQNKSEESISITSDSLSKEESNVNLPRNENSKSESSIDIILDGQKKSETSVSISLDTEKKERNEIDSYVHGVSSKESAKNHDEIDSYVHGVSSKESVKDYDEINSYIKGVTDSSISKESNEIDNYVHGVSSKESAKDYDEIDSYVKGVTDSTKNKESDEISNYVNGVSDSAEKKESDEISNYVNGVTDSEEKKEENEIVNYVKGVTDTSEKKESDEITNYVNGVSSSELSKTGEEISSYTKGISNVSEKKEADEVSSYVKGVTSDILSKESDEINSYTKGVSNSSEKKESSEIDDYVTGINGNELAKEKETALSNKTGILLDRKDGSPKFKEKNYSYDDVLKEVLKEIKDEQNSKATVNTDKEYSKYNVVKPGELSNSSAEVFNYSGIHIDFSKIKDQEKKDQTTTSYSTIIGSKNGKSFNDILPYNIPLHDNDPKTNTAIANKVGDLTKNDVISVAGIDLGENYQVGSQNYEIGSSSEVSIENATSNIGNSITASIKSAFDKYGNYADRVSLKGTDGNVVDGAISLSGIDQLNIGLDNYTVSSSTISVKPNATDSSSKAYWGKYSVGSGIDSYDLTTGDYKSRPILKGTNGTADIESVKNFTSYDQSDIGLNNYTVGSESNIAINRKNDTNNSYSGDVSIGSVVTASSGDFDSNGYYTNRANLKGTKGTASKDAQKLNGIDAENIGYDNYTVGSGSTISVENNNDTSIGSVITAASTEYDKIGAYTRKSKKIADQKSEISYIESSAPNAYTTDTTFTKIRNSSNSEYSPTFDLTDLLPPREGMADTIKTWAKSMGLTSNTSIGKNIAGWAKSQFGVDISGTETMWDWMKPQFSSDDTITGTDWTRFGQRALTGEVASAVYSRLWSNVLEGSNPSEDKGNWQWPTSLSAVSSDIDSLADVFSPVVDAISSTVGSFSIDSLLNGDKKKAEYSGFIPTVMSNQIGKSASGIFGSMSNYYDTIRKRLLYKTYGVTDADSTLIASAYKSGTADKTSTAKWVDNDIEHANSKSENVFRANFTGLDKQYQRIITALDTPSEYRKYLPETDTVFERFWNVSKKRGIDGPELGKDTDTQMTTNEAGIKFDWRKFSLNSKPDSSDDFSSENGYLTNANNPNYPNLREEVRSYLKEQSIYDDDTYREKVAQDLIKFNFLLTDYDDNTGFNDFISEINKYYSNNDGAVAKYGTVNTWTHYIPSKGMEKLYSDILNNANNNEPVYNLITSDNSESGAYNDTNFHDAHLTALFEAQPTTKNDFRKKFYNFIKNNNGERDSDNNLDKVKDTLYYLEKPNGATDNDVSVDLSTIHQPSDENKYFNTIDQNIQSASNNPTEDEINERHMIQYQAVLNYFEKKLGNTYKKDIRKNMVKIIQNAELFEDSDNPMGTKASKYGGDGIFAFSWFNSTYVDGSSKYDSKNSYSDITQLLSETKVNGNSYPQWDKTKKYESTSNVQVVNSLDLTKYSVAITSSNTEALFKEKIETLTGRTKSKTLLPVAISSVQSIGQKGIETLVTNNGTFYVDSGVKEEPKEDAKKYSASNQPAGSDVFSIDDNGAITRKDSKNTYYAKITDAHTKLFYEEIINTDLTFDNKSVGVVRYKGNGLGGLIVNSGYALNKQFNGKGTMFFEIPFQFNPEISGESRSANWNGVTAFGRTHEHFVYSNTGARGIQLKTSYAILDFDNEGQIYDKFGNLYQNINKDTGVASDPENSSKKISLRNDQMSWARGWDEDYLLMIINMYRSLVLPISAYGTVTPPIVIIDFGQYLGNFTRLKDAYHNARWIISEYSIDPNYDTGFTKSKTPRLFDITLSLKEVYNGWHDAQDFFEINKHLQNWQDKGSTLAE